MQKKIIALAIAGLSSAAFAQSNVTISGFVDGGYYSQSIQTATVMDTKASFASNGSGTSQLNLTMTEDLGGGMKAGFFMETDLGVASQAGVAMGNSTNYLTLSGPWGEVRGGTVNTQALVATIAAQPFSTAIGSGISGAFGRLSRAGVNGSTGTAGTSAVNAEGETTTTTAAYAGVRSVRVNNSLSYQTPSMSGFSANLQWASKNNDAAVAAAGNSPGFVGVGLAYNNGPINVHYVNETTTAGSVAAPGAMNGGSAAFGANEKVVHNVLTGNYTFGPATVYAGWTSSKGTVSGAADTANARSWNVALKYAVSGALSIGANILKVDDKLAGDKDRNLNALGVDYALSKRTNLYGRWESGDNDRSSATGNNIGGFTRYQVGMKHAF